MVGLLKRVIGVCFEVIMLLLVGITTISCRNYAMVHNIVTAQIEGVTDTKQYMVYEDITTVVESNYKLVVGDTVRVVYDEAMGTIEFMGAGKFLMMYLIALFSGIVGLLLLLDYNTFMILSTIVVYVINVFIIAPYSDGILVLKQFDAICRYSKTGIFWLIVLNTVLLSGYFIHFVISYVKEKRELMLQMKN